MDMGAGLAALAESHVCTPSPGSEASLGPGEPGCLASQPVDYWVSRTRTWEQHEVREAPPWAARTRRVPAPASPEAHPSSFIHSTNTSRALCPCQAQRNLPGKKR